MKLLIITIAILIIIHNYLKNRLISSSTMWVGCYLMIFILYPLFTKEIYVNAELIDICAFFGILFYGLGVLIGDKKIVSEEIGFSPAKTKQILNFKFSLILFYVVLFILLFYLYFKIGFSGIKSIFNGEVTTSELIFGENHTLGNIFIYLNNLLIPFVIATWISGKTKKEMIEKTITLIIFTIISLILSYTRLFLICTLVIVWFYEMRNMHVKKQMVVSTIAVLGMTFLMVFLNFFRYLGTSNLHDFWSYINLDYIFESTDFSASYIWFNELLKIDSPYIIPVTYLKPIFVFIPRSLWINKPNPISLDILKILNPELILAGYSTAGNSVLGEGYAIMGWMGILIFPFIWGLITTILDKKYYYRIKNGESNSLWVFTYYIFSSFIIISGQRGDWSQYMVIVIWLFIIPLYLENMFISSLKNNTLIVNERI